MSLNVKTSVMFRHTSQNVTLTILYRNYSTGDFSLTVWKMCFASQLTKNKIKYSGAEVREANGNI